MTMNILQIKESVRALVRSIDDTTLVLIAAGLLGFVIGMLHATWQVSLESAQVVAHVVAYPTPTPFYWYHTKLWTLMVQLPALFLFFGISERILSFIVSGIVGMFSFQALSLVIYALSGRKLLAILSPSFIYTTEAVSLFSGSYYIYLMATMHTYGIIGLSFAVLVLGLISVGYNRLGGFLLGLAPAVHPSIGLWLILIVAITLIWRRDEKGKIKEVIRYGMLGICVSAVSALYQFVFVMDVPKVDYAVSRAYLSAFVTYWDVHRIQLPLLSKAMFANLGVISLSLLLLRQKEKIFFKKGEYLLRFFCIAGCMGIAAVFISWLPANYLPETLLALMPQRILDFAPYALAPILIGALAFEKNRLSKQLLLLLLIPGLLLWYAVYENTDATVATVTAVAMIGLFLFLKPTTAEDHTPRYHAVLTVIYALILGGLVWIVARHLTVSRLLPILCAGAITIGFLSWHTLTRSGKKLPTLFTKAVLVFSLLTTIVLVQRIVIFSERRFQGITDWTNDAALKRASESELLIATSLDFRLIQLRTRRPVLLASLDQIPYVPESGKAINEILINIYGLDLLHPPHSQTPLVDNTLVMDINKKTWEERPLEEWQRVRETFRVSNLITPPDWNLQLPKVASDSELAVYEIRNYLPSD